MTVNLTDLKAELDTDPKALGYAAHVTSGSTAALARMLNEVGLSGESIDVESVSVDDAKHALDYVEVGSLTADKRGELAILLSGVRLKVKNANVRNAFADIFAGGSNSRAALIALQDRSAARAEVLFGMDVVVTHSTVAKALAS